MFLEFWAGLGGVEPGAEAQKANPVGGRPCGLEIICSAAIKPRALILSGGTTSGSMSLDLGSLFLVQFLLEEHNSRIPDRILPEDSTYQTRSGSGEWLSRSLLSPFVPPRPLEQRFGARKSLLQRNNTFPAHADGVINRRQTAGWPRSTLSAPPGKGSAASVLPVIRP